RQRPVEPGGLVVLAVGVVAAPLGPTELVAAEQHRDTLGQQQRREEVALLPATQAGDRGVIRRAFHAAVPRPVVVRAVAVVVPVGLVVLGVVRDEAGQGEAVEGGDEVGVGGGAAALHSVGVGAPGEAVRHSGQRPVLPPPVVAYRVAEFAVPLGPQR